jgi:hypothetical protein
VAEGIAIVVILLFLGLVALLFVGMLFAQDIEGLDQEWRLHTEQQAARRAGSSPPRRPRRSSPDAQAGSVRTAEVASEQECLVSTRQAVASELLHRRSGSASAQSSATVLT